MMVANSQSSGGENLLLPILLIENIGRCSQNSRGSKTCALWNFSHYEVLLVVHLEDNLLQCREIFSPKLMSFIRKFQGCTK